MVRDELNRWGDGDGFEQLEPVVDLARYLALLRILLIKAKPR